MAYSLTSKCTKMFCKRTVLVQLIIENMVTCFWKAVYIIIFLIYFLKICYGD